MRRTLVLAVCLVLVGATQVLAQKGDPQAACDDAYVVDIGPSILSQPDGTYQTTTQDCTGTPSCDDYFDIVCPEGAQLDLTFCAQGGSASWDTGLSVYGGLEFDQQFACNDDTCGLQSELSYVFTSTMPVRVRVGGFGGANGPYTLAYRAPATCLIRGAIPVELESFEIER